MVDLKGWRCKRCGHEWLPRNKEETPKVCPKCKNPYWNRERQHANKALKPDGSEANE